MRVFVDANTLISGIVFRGLEHEVLKLASKEKTELITSEDVINEVTAVLVRKFPRSSALFNEFIVSSRIQVIPRSSYLELISLQVVRDKKDQHVLAAALFSNCKYLVSGDKDLTTLKRYCEIEIVTSRQLLALAEFS
ncbi:MAG: putative toxin-antitoxin system toxin component, PIN family [Candidatus Micrarchaeota archaeon]